MYSDHIVPTQTLQEDIMKKLGLIAMIIAVGIVLGSGREAQAQECFIGEVRMFAGNFAPRGWALCDGQLLAIAENESLFAIIGTIYGGDGRRTLALPDLRGRVPVHQGKGPGLVEKKLGKKFGSATATLQERNEAGAKTEEGDAVKVVGGHMISVEQPSIALNYIICMDGVFPSRK
jgi:microcystin-dependent protein